jgi:hypothetical protein
MIAPVDLGAILSMMRKAPETNASDGALMLGETRWLARRCWISSAAT